MRTTLAGIVLLLATLAGTAARGQTFPATFSPLYCGRGFMIDGYRDQSGAVDDRDLVGNVVAPAGFRAVDDQFLYLRLRLDGSPDAGQRADAVRLGVRALHRRRSDQLRDPDRRRRRRRDRAPLQQHRRRPSPTARPIPPISCVMTYPFAANGRVVDAGAVPRSAAETTPSSTGRCRGATSPGWGSTRGTLVHLWAASSTNPDRLDGDFACHDGGGGGNVPSLSRDTSAPIAPDPTGAPVRSAAPAAATAAAATDRRLRHRGGTRLRLRRRRERSAAPGDRAFVFGSRLDPGAPAPGLREAGLLRALAGR